jgi:N-acetylmuramoyl-L-alanine amidase
MAIVDNFIQGVAKKTLLHEGSPYSPTRVVIHYSVTSTMAQAVNALNGQNPPLSYHILIDKDGTAFQTRSFLLHAAHPGRSNWKATGGVNNSSTLMKSSIGICLINRGFDINPGSMPASQVFSGELIYNPGDPTMKKWEAYPQAQVDTCFAIVRDIIATYPIIEIVGHHDVAIMGKFDPGPAFPLVELDALIPGSKPLGLRTTTKQPGVVLRKLPRASGPAIATLPNGKALHVRSVVYGPPSQALSTTPAGKRYVTRWASVDIAGDNKHSGFVDMKGLATTPLSSAFEALL